MSRFRMILTSLLCFIGAPSLHGQVDVYIMASGKPRFGYLPVVKDNLVVWQRFPDRATDASGPGLIQCRNITNLDSPVINVTEFSAGIGGLFLSKGHLFWGEAPESIIWARRRSELEGGTDY